jgi:hypothetical protein
MLVCESCGSLLISDGTNWMCPRKAMPYEHNAEHKPTVLPDKRIGLQKQVSA